MIEWIDKIRVVLNECKDPINNLQARTLRDDALDALSLEVMHLSRKEFESYATNDKELHDLSWFYTRFVHNKYLTAGAGRSLPDKE
ncbi:hypothetical protein [Sphingobacterium litopenaei]|uniref:Uncharacterized protein n=1 Tax=Sphingobacterium litopenaei TaxID=2763500 RepID=A0ABR7YH04_9SPHI|nr:hypothetical protein [Sphingobacterium litopenaei]MBD1430602.1 hypothetical protein [Sphingobacterium litopenaei]